MTPDLALALLHPDEKVRVFTRRRFRPYRGHVLGHRGWSVVIVSSRGFRHAIRYDEILFVVRSPRTLAFREES